MLRIVLLESNRELALQLKEKLELHPAITVVATFQFHQMLLDSIDEFIFDLVLMNFALGSNEAIRISMELESKKYKVALMSSFSSFQSELLCYAVTGDFLVNKAMDLPAFHEQILRRSEGSPTWPVVLVRELVKRAYLDKMSENLEIVLQNVTLARVSTIKIGKGAKMELKMLLKKRLKSQLVDNF